MQTKNIATTLLAGVLALGVAGSSMAVADQYMGGYIAEPQIEIAPEEAGNYYSGHRRDWRHDYRRHHRPRVCEPREAVEKAHWMGLRRAGIHRVSHDAIVVVGAYYGNWAKIAFDRWSPHCRVIGTRGI